MHNIAYSSDKTVQEFTKKERKYSLVDQASVYKQPHVLQAVFQTTPTLDTQNPPQWTTQMTIFVS